MYSQRWITTFTVIAQALFVGFGVDKVCIVVSDSETESLERNNVTLLDVHQCTNDLGTYLVPFAFVTSTLVLTDVEPEKTSNETPTLKVIDTPIELASTEKVRTRGKLMI